jgi:protein phosphatase 1 regulatory subunit 37
LFISKASSLQFLDISANILDKKSVEYLVASFKGSSPDQALKGTSQIGSNLPKQPCVLSLRIDDCTLRPGALEALGKIIQYCVSLKKIG